jgi:hypothetical protein
MTSTAELTSPSSANLPAGPLDDSYTLDHKYTRTDGRIYLSGVQALVRLPLMQRLRDEAAGLDTAGLHQRLPGQPAGGFDLELWRARQHLEAARVKFTPGLNEDLGATMVWGTQQTNLFPGAKVQGRVRHVVRQGVPAWTAAAMCSSMPTRPVHRCMAACWRWPPTTTPAAARPCHTAAKMNSSAR